MNCGCKGCSGRYENRLITRAFRQGDDVAVLDNIPVEVCDICGNTLLAPETVRHIELLLKARGAPSRTVPLYEYA